MKCRPVRYALLAATAVILVSCSENKGPSGGRSPDRETTSAPDISPSAAPGVAFNFAYEFSLPDNRIAATQEAHAAACEKLGLAQCRITGMSYSVNQNEEVAAELDLKLDPAIARQFGKSSQKSVEASDGKLMRLDIGSSDEGQAIDQAAKQKSDVSTQIAQLQQELDKTKPGTAARANLTEQIQGLQQQASEQTHNIESHRSVLASTPMEFHYYGRGGVPGFRGNPIREAWRTLVTTAVWLVGTLLQALAVLLPLFVLLALLVGLWRTRSVRALRAWVKGPQESDA
jgi:hypothetical protein